MPPRSLPASQTRAPSVPGALFRRTMGHFSTGVTVVSAFGAAGMPSGTTANSVTSVSLDPPLVLVCLRHGSSTLRAILETGRFGISILGAHQRDISDRFARPSSPDSWADVPRRDTGRVPLVRDALASLVCELHDTPDGGDHVIVVGRVVGADHADDEADPLLFHRGRYVGAHAPAPHDPVPVEVGIPSALGRLAMTPLADVPGVVSVAVSVGRPRDSEAPVLYVHRGCVLGDALGSPLCPRAATLRETLAVMGDECPGVIVYHRRQTGAEACCLRGGGADEALSGDEVTAVRRAVRALGLGAVRPLAPEHHVTQLAEAGVPVAPAAGRPPAGPGGARVHA